MPAFQMRQLIVLLASLPTIRCDLPVHCLRHQIIGEWTFELGALSKHRSSCGHQHPDVEESQPQGIDGAAEAKRITLLEPNIARTASGSPGTFTMIYDEGFEVKVDGKIFFAFSRFDFKSAGQTNVTENSGRSHCGETARGWYRDESRTMWGCYKASKVIQNISLLSVVKSKRPFSLNYDKPRTLEWHKQRVRRINMMQTSWTARVYHRFVGKSLRELNSYAGIVRMSPRQSPGKSKAALLELDSENCPELPELRRTSSGDVLSHMLLKGQKALKPCQIRKQLQTFEQPVDPKVKEVEDSLPASFDWRQGHDGRNFLEPTMDQADCGSCYVVSTMRMLTARHKIKTNDTSAESWSISLPLHCAEYNQGCKGGYGFLASKWSEDVGLLPARCAPYNTSGTCSVSGCDVSKLAKRYRVANHRLIGGWYGNGSSIGMMLEVYRHGPIVVSFEPSEDFMMYAGGIFTQQVMGVPAPLERSHTEWEKTDHAVLVVGWGEELGQKYWLVQNSWGTDWGDGGFFKIARDINDSGIESQAEAADVVEDDHPEVLDEFLRQVRP